MTAQPPPPAPPQAQPQTPPQTPPPGLAERKESKSRFCLLSCIGCVGCGGAILLALVIGGYYAFDRLMPTEPLPPSDFTASEEDLDNMQNEFATLKKQLDSGEETEVTIDYTERQLNILGQLLMREEESIQVLDSAIEGDILRVRFSATDKNNPGRYLNIVFAGRIHVNSEKAVLDPEELQVGSFRFTEELEGFEAEAQAELEKKIRESLYRVRLEHGIDIEEVVVADGRLRARFRKVEK